ncbi:MAG: hypothetical protein JW951_01350, partial [Lentisphaerae bacterium]|nr:hypothetical protein [Lentisphaerota bacterium]
ETAVSHEPAPYAGTTLDLQEVDLERAGRAVVREHVAVLEQTYRHLQPLNLERYFKLLRYAPGIEEYAALAALERVLTGSSDYAHVVCDTPPTGLTLRMLALPQLTLDWIGRLAALRREILDKRHTIYRLSRGDETSTTLPYRAADDPVMRTLDAMQARYTRLQTALAGPDTDVVVVFNPDRLALAESRRLLAGLAALGLSCRTAWHNKFPAGDPAEAERVEAALLGPYPGIRRIRVGTGHAWDTELAV